MVQCGGMLAKACFPGWLRCRRTPIRFCSGAIREGFGNTLILEGSSKHASPAVRRVFYVVLEALGGASGAPPRRTGKARNCLGNSLKSSGLQKSIKGPNAREMDDAGVRGARARARATDASIISTIGDPCITRWAFDASLQNHTYPDTYTFTHTYTFTCTYAF